MTLSSLLHLVYALVWCCCVFFALLGWGALLLRALGVRRISAAESVCLGAAVLVTLGGCLNLLGLITVPVLVGVTGLGALLAIALRIALPRIAARRRPAMRISKIPSRLLVVALLVLAFRLTGSVHTTYYQTSDDLNFYLAEPLKTLELHRVAPDPFSERRIMSSVGAAYFLQDMFLAALPLEDIQLADRGLGVLLLFALGCAAAAVFELTSTQAAAVAIVALLTPQLLFNQTFIVLPSALFFALPFVMADPALDDRPDAIRCFLAGMIAACIASLKSTYLPHGAVFCFLACLLCGRRQQSRHPWRDGATAVAAACLGGVLVLLPWMIASHADSGTYFYPILGRGFHYTAYPQFPKPSSAGVQVFLHKVAPFAAPMIGLLLLQIWLYPWDRRVRAVASLTAASALSILLLGAETGGESMRRYNYPSMVPAILLTLVLAFRQVNLSPGSVRYRLGLLFASALAAATAIYIGLSPWTQEYALMLSNFSAGLRYTPIAPSAIAEEYSRLNASLPTDGVILETLTDPYLLNFETHRIELADFPGAAGPPPGWPIFQNGQELARYLQAHAIRYVAFSYADAATEDVWNESVVQGRLMSVWIQSEREMSLRAHRQYMQLYATRRAVYDDGRIFVIDLTRKRA